MIWTEMMSCKLISAQRKLVNVYLHNWTPFDERFPPPETGGSYLALAVARAPIATVRRSVAAGSIPSHSWAEGPRVPPPSELECPLMEQARSNHCSN